MAASNTPGGPDKAGGDHDITKAAMKKYWAENVRLMLILLAVWFSVSFGAGILFRDTLDQLSIGGAPLGFWFAQQGSIYVFVILIFVYSALMHRIEQKYDVDDDEG
jgi:putative solute:sodium symporter small subunit